MENGLVQRIEALNACAASDAHEAGSVLFAICDDYGRVNQHVALLQSTLGDMAVARPEADFIAGGTNLNVFSNFDMFRMLSQNLR